MNRAVEGERDVQYRIELFVWDPENAFKSLYTEDHISENNKPEQSNFNVCVQHYSGDFVVTF
jgi:hypothetical protein